MFRRRRFFISGDGYIGLAPLRTQEGDVLAFFVRAGVPFVLSESAEHSSDYILIGPCYVHRFMDREAVKGKEAFAARTVQII